MEKYKIWSCKLNRAYTLKSHRTLEAAAKKAGDYGVVYDPKDDSVYQAFTMADNSVQLFHSVKNAARCSIGKFDMRAEMDSFGISRPKSETPNKTTLEN